MKENLYTVLTLWIIAMIGVITAIVIQTNNYKERCETMSGVYVDGICYKKDAIIFVR